MYAHKNFMNESASQKIKKEAFLSFLSIHLNHQNLENDHPQPSYLMSNGCIVWFNEANLCIFHK